MRTFTRTLVAATAVPALVLGAAACSDDDNTAQSENTASQASIDDLSARVERNEMIFAVVSISKLGLHDMDETLNDAGTIEPSFAPNTRTAVRLLALTDWGEFQAEADTVRGHAEDLMTALADEDVDAAAAAAADLHDSEHDFNTAVWNVVAKDLKPEFGGPQPEEREESGTPTAGETPEAEATP